METDQIVPPNGGTVVVRKGETARATRERAEREAVAAEQERVNRTQHTGSAERPEMLPGYDKAVEGGWQIVPLYAATRDGSTLTGTAAQVLEQIEQQR